MAIGDEICARLAGSTASASKAFARLAARTDTQYSYTNALVAVDANGEPAGACICYDGARLKQLRAPAARLFLSEFGFDITTSGDETAPGELYIDTLAVEPAYRRQGIAGALLRQAIDSAATQGLPAGLLAEPHNHNALALYEKTGFRRIGWRLFAGVQMHHLLTDAPQ